MPIDQLVTDYYLQVHQRHLCQMVQLLLCWSSTLDHCRSLLPVHHRPLIYLFYTSFRDYNKCIFRICLGSACPTSVIPLVSSLTPREPDSQYFHHVRSLRSADWSLRCSVICRFRLSSRWKSSVKNASINHSCPWANIQHQTHQLMGGKRPHACLMRQTHRLPSLILKHLIVHQIEQKELCNTLYDVAATLTAFCYEGKSPN